MHFANVCETCFFWLRQVRRICHSLDFESVKILVHSFDTSRVNYCTSLLASSPKKVSDKLQRVQNATAHLITGTQKHKHGLSRLLRGDLHWLTIAQRVQYKLAVTVHRCLQYRAPSSDCCVPISEVSGRQHLCSASSHKLNIPRLCRNTFGLRLSQSPFRRFGIHCQIRYVIQPSSLNVLGRT